MELWHPRAISAPANKASGSFIDVPPKIVLHTVEGRGTYSYNPANYYGNPYWPHSTIDGVGIHQHLPIDVYGFALANAAGGVETNRAFAIQCEILWFSANIADLPDDIMGHLADWVGWVAEQTGAPIDFAEFRGAGSAGENAPQRFSGVEWLAFSGICGHQHVPENDHWDPGAFPVERLRALLNPQPSQEDYTMFIGDAPPERGGGVWQSDGVLRKPVRTGDTWPQLGDDGARVAKHIGVFEVGTFDDLIDIEAELAKLREPHVAGGVDLSSVADQVAARVVDLLSNRLRD